MSKKEQPKLKIRVAGGEIFELEMRIAQMCPYFDEYTREKPVAQKAATERVQGEPSTSAGGVGKEDSTGEEPAHDASPSKKSRLEKDIKKDKKENVPPEKPEENPEAAELQEIKSEEDKTSQSEDAAQERGNEEGTETRDDAQADDSNDTEATVSEEEEEEEKPRTAKEEEIAKWKKDGVVDLCTVEANFLTKKVMEALVWWGEHHYHDTPHEPCQPNKKIIEVPMWDNAFIRYTENINKKLLFDLMQAADFLGIERLLDYLSRFVSEKIQEKTPEGIQEYFTVPRLSPENSPQAGDPQGAGN